MEGTALDFEEDKGSRKEIFKTLGTIDKWIGD
jgi:hypothetical protein